MYFFQLYTYINQLQFIRPRCIASSSQDSGHKVIVLYACLHLVEFLYAVLRLKSHRFHLYYHHLFLL